MMPLNACPPVTSPIPSTAPRYTAAQLRRPGPLSCEDSFTSYLRSEAVGAMAGPREKEQENRAVGRHVEHQQRSRLAAPLRVPGGDLRLGLWWRADPRHEPPHAAASQNAEGKELQDRDRHQYSTAPVSLTLPMVRTLPGSPDTSPTVTTSVPDVGGVVFCHADICCQRVTFFQGAYDGRYVRFSKYAPFCPGCSSVSDRRAISSQSIGVCTGCDFCSTRSPEDSLRGVSRPSASHRAARLARHSSSACSAAARLSARVGLLSLLAARCARLAARRSRSARLAAIQSIWLGV